MNPVIIKEIRIRNVTIVLVDCGTKGPSRFLATYTRVGVDVLKLIPQKTAPKPEADKINKFAEARNRPDWMVYPLLTLWQAEKRYNLMIANADKVEFIEHKK